MNGRRVMVGAMVLSTVVGLDSLYQVGGWSFGPSSPAARDACALQGGREGDLFLVHHCAPDPFRNSAAR